MQRLLLYSALVIYLVIITNRQLIFLFRFILNTLVLYSIVQDHPGTSRLNTNLRLDKHHLYFQ